MLLSEPGNNICDQVQKLIEEVACPDHGEVTFWGSFEHPNHVNPLLLRLYLDHDNIFYI